jgi:hypothetical protein
VNYLMKKIMSLMLGLSLINGCRYQGVGQTDINKQKSAKRRKTQKGTDTTEKKA